MNKIEEAIYRSNFPKLSVRINRFKHKRTGEIRWCVMEVSTPLTKSKHCYIYNASEWEMLEAEPLEGVERIQECYDQDMLEQMGKNNET